MGNKQISAAPNGLLVDINAGLGNQLFMIANAYAYCLEYKKRLYIPDGWKGVSKSRPAYWETLLYKCKPFLIDEKIARNVKSEHIYTESDFTYKKIPHFSNSVIFKGYFQSEQYFKKYEEEVRELFEIPYYLTDFVEKKHKEWYILDNDILVGVHIRRGDYLKHPGKHILVPKSYYQECKTLITKRIGVKPRFIYFSDDIEWVKNNLTIESKDIVVSGLKDYEDFVLLSSCHHFINGNSTFSWWAAYLSKSYKQYLNIKGNILHKELTSKEKIVFMPSEWFGIRGPRSWKDIYPEDAVVYNSKMKRPEQIFFMGIISCKKYEVRRRMQNMKGCMFPYKYFIGDPQLKEAVEKDGIIYLPCKDNYESLPEKVYHMIKWVSENYPKVEYVIKADDDVKFNFNLFKDYARDVYIKQYDYAGMKIKINGGLNGYHIGKSEDEKLNKSKIYMPTTTYCAGSCYFLSMKSVKILVKNMLKQYTIYEDQSVGYCLQKSGIEPNNIPIRNNACFWD